MLSNRSLLDHRLYQVRQSEVPLSRITHFGLAHARYRIVTSNAASGPGGSALPNVAAVLLPIIAVIGGVALPAILIHSLFGVAARIVGYLTEGFTTVKDAIAGALPGKHSETPQVERKNTPRLSYSPISPSNGAGQAVAVAAAVAGQGEESEPTKGPMPTGPSTAETGAGSENRAPVNANGKILNPGLVAQAAASLPSPVAKPVALSRKQISTEAIIKRAAETVGISPAIMLALGYLESAFQPLVGAATSAAKGLFQFIPKTWAQMVRKYGSKYGVEIGDILDPWSNAIMGALYAKDNATRLKSAGLSSPTALDLYIAHFLGPDGAILFFNNLDAVGASLLPSAAASNRSIFWDKNGRPRTIREIYQLFAQRMGNANVAIGNSQSQMNEEYTRMASAGWTATPAMVASSMRKQQSNFAVAQKGKDAEPYKVALADGIIVADKNAYFQ